MKSLTILVALSLSALPSFGQTIGINFNYDTNRQGASLASTDTAGVVSADNYNNIAGGFGTISGGIQSWSNSNLTNGAGSLSGVSLTATTDNTNSDGSTPPQPDGLYGQGGAVSGDGSSELFSGGIQVRSHTVTADLSGLSLFAPSGYDAYVYLSAGNSVSTTVSTGDSSTTILPSGYAGSYVNGTGGFAGDYVVFKGLSGNTLDLTIDATTPFTDPQTDVAGIEIVAASAPEPSTWAMMFGGLGFLMLMVRRRMTSQSPR